MEAGARPHIPIYRSSASSVSQISQFCTRTPADPWPAMKRLMRPEAESQFSVQLRSTFSLVALCCIAVAALQHSAPSLTVALASGGAATLVLRKPSGEVITTDGTDVLDADYFPWNKDLRDHFAADQEAKAAEVADKEKEDAAAQRAAAKKWVPSLGFYVDKGKEHGHASTATRPQRRSPTNARTSLTFTSGLSAVLDSALDDRDTPREEALRLHALLAHSTSKHVERFMKAFKQEARHTGTEATEEYLASMLDRDKKRRHMLSQAKQLPYKYQGHEQWSKTPNFSTKGYWPLVGDPGDIKMFKLGVRPLALDKSLVKSPNFNIKGYWPLDANTHKLAGRNVAVNRWPIGEEHPMPEQVQGDNVMSLNYWSNFLDTGSTGPEPHRAPAARPPLPSPPMQLPLPTHPCLRASETSHHVLARIAGRMGLCVEGEKDLSMSRSRTQGRGHLAQVVGYTQPQTHRIRLGASGVGLRVHGGGGRGAGRHADQVDAALSTQ